MPELPEVESVRRLMQDAFVGHRIVSVLLPPDEILLEKRPPQLFIDALTSSPIREVGRRGKFWWIQPEAGPAIHGHLGMTGWIREIGLPSIRLKDMGNAPMDDEHGVPRFMRVLWETESGRKLAFTDPRRLARMWIGDGADDPRVKRLGRDAYNDLPSLGELTDSFAKRKAPIKAVLMDQTFLAGIGNYLADEILYQARVNPNRPMNSLTKSEIKRVRERMELILNHAVLVNADYEKFPPDWLFHHRWGGAKGPELIDGREITRETVGGRTTAWVPGWQK